MCHKKYFLIYFRKILFLCKNKNKNVDKYNNEKGNLKEVYK